MLIEVGPPLISQPTRGFEIQWSWSLIIVVNIPSHQVHNDISKTHQVQREKRRNADLGYIKYTMICLYLENI